VPRLTVSAVKSLFDYPKLFYDYYWDSLGGWNQTIGAGNIQLSGLGIILNTGAVINDVTRIYKFTDYMLRIFRPTWAYEQMLKVKTFYSAATAEYYHVIGNSDLNQIHVGFKTVNTTIYGCVCDAVAETLTPALATLPIAGSYYVLLQVTFKPRASVDFYINNTWKGRLTPFTYSGTSATGRLDFNVRTLAAAAAALEIGELRYILV